MIASTRPLALRVSSVGTTLRTTVKPFVSRSSKFCAVRLIAAAVRSLVVGGVATRHRRHHGTVQYS